MLEHVNAQFLLIGSSNADLSDATQPQAEDQRAGKDDPKDALGELEDEDTRRAQSLQRELSSNL